MDKIEDILIRYLEGPLSTGDQATLDTWLSAAPHNRHIFDRIRDEGRFSRELAALGDIDNRKGWEKLSGLIGLEPPAPRVSAIRRWWWAAAAVTVAGFSTWFWFRTAPAPPADIAQQTNIQPGREGAVLTLADGSQVLLDTIRQGVAALQGGATAKVVNGALVYEGSAANLVYNTMTTPKGRQFKLTLPDGSKVWLNAASSIQYPVTFPSKKRKVKVYGEAYFEIAQDAARPFIVDVDGKQTVEVLGTSFNINSYRDEDRIRTTLAEGAVKVTAGNTVTLHPGQQATGTPLKVVQDVNMEKITAWKNGLFHFDDLSLPEVMRQLERWYDIEVVYEKDIPNIEIKGKITRDTSLEDLLVVLEKVGVHYRLEQRQLIILP